MNAPHLISRRRRGTWLHYYREIGGRQTPMPEVKGLPPEDPAVIAAYQVRHLHRAKPETPAAGTLAHAVVAYRESREWADLSPQTRAMRLAILRRYLREDADRPLVTIDQDAVEMALARLSPSAQRNHVKALRGLFAYARKARLIRRDPTQGVSLDPMRTKGHPTAAPEHVAAFLARWPIETVEGLAFRLACHTGAARQDLARLGPRNVQGDVLTYARGKTGVVAYVPITRELRALIEHTAAGGVIWPTFITTASGRPYAPGSLGNLMGEASRAAGLPPGMAIHAARKAFCVMWAERGRSAPEIAAMAGHMSLSEVARYTREADRRRMAAMLVVGDV